MLYRKGTVRGREAIAFWPDSRENLRGDLDPARLPEYALETRTRSADGMTLAEVQDLTPLTQWQGRLRDAERFFQAADLCVREGWCVVMKLDALYVRGDGSPCFIALPYAEASPGDADAVRRYLRDPNDFDSFLPYYPLEDPAPSAVGEDAQNGNFFNRPGGGQESKPFFGQEAAQEVTHMFAQQPSPSDAQTPADDMAGPVDPAGAPTEETEPGGFGGLVTEANDDAPTGSFGGLVQKETAEAETTSGFLQPLPPQPEAPSPEGREAARTMVTTTFEKFSVAFRAFLDSDAAEASGAGQTPGEETPVSNDGESDFTFGTKDMEELPREVPQVAAVEAEPPAAPVTKAPVTAAPEPPVDPMAGEDAGMADMDFSTMFSGFDLESEAPAAPETPPRKPAAAARNEAESLGDVSDVMSFFEDLMNESDQP